MRLFCITLLLVQSTVMAQEVCEQSFAKFLTIFERDNELQLQNTSYPLKFTFVDNESFIEPEQVKIELTRKQVEAKYFPLFPGPEQQKKVPFIKKVTDVTPEIKEVELNKPDTGYKLSYRFEKLGACWKLAEYNNHSL